MSDDLSHCPFCGGTDLDPLANCVGCLVCGARGPTQEQIEILCDPDLAKEQWNRRAIPATDAPGIYEINLGPGGTITVGEGGHFTVKTVDGRTAVSAERCVIRGVGEPATDAREAALREAAAVADAFADKSIGDADLWLKDGMPKTAAIAREHAQAARTVAAAILALIGEARDD